MTDPSATSRRTRQIHLRVSDKEHETFQAVAERTGLSLSEVVRRRMLGIKVVPTREITRLLNEMRRQGGLMKYLSMRGQPVRDIAMDVRDTADRMEAFVRALDDSGIAEG